MNGFGRQSLIAGLVAQSQVTVTKNEQDECLASDEEGNSVIWASERGSFPMEHEEIRLNPYTQEWFCVVCGRTSDHINEEDARVELELHECRLTTRSSGK